MTEELNYTPQMSALARQPQSETAATVLAAQAKAQIEARYIVAERHPRDFDIVRQRFLKNCQRPSFCEVAIYHKPVGNGVTGPSIRFAEAAARCMGNIDTPTQTIYDDAERRIVRVSTTDLETNVSYSLDVTVSKTVERRALKPGETPLKTRLNSSNKTIFILEATDDDILNKQNALISKAARTMILRLVDGDLVDEGMDMVRMTLARRDAEDPDTAKRKLFDAFAVLGVSADQIKEFLGHKAETLAPKELIELRGLWTALRDGETSWREIIDAKKTPSDASTATGSVGKSLKETIKAAAVILPAAAEAVTESPATTEDEDF